MIDDDGVERQLKITNLRLNDAQDEIARLALAAEEATTALKLLLHELGGEATISEKTLTEFVDSELLFEVQPDAPEAYYKLKLMKDGT